MILPQGLTTVFKVFKAETFSFNSLLFMYSILWINTELSNRDYQGDQQLYLMQSYLKNSMFCKILLFQ